MPPVTRRGGFLPDKAKSGDDKLAILSKEQKLPKLGKARKKRKVPFVQGFRKPTKRTILAALEEDNEEKLDGFPPLPSPSHPSDWLAGYLEEGQTVASFLSTCPWMGNRKASRYKGEFKGGQGGLGQRYPDGKLYLVEVKGTDAGEQQQQQGLLDLPQLANFCSLYIRLPVAILEPLCLEEKGGGGPVLQGRRLGQRQHGSKRQLNTASILHVLREQKTPDNCLALLAVTMEDLYQESPDLFIAGLAQGNRRVGVFSFYR